MRVRAAEHAAAGQHAEHAHVRRLTVDQHLVADRQERTLRARELSRQAGLDDLPLGAHPTDLVARPHDHGRSPGERLVLAVGLLLDQRVLQETQHPQVKVRVAQPVRPDRERIPT